MRFRSGEYHRAPLLDRFACRVDDFTGVDGCWAWPGAKSGYGYGQIAIGGAPRRAIHAHRVSWTHFRGPIPDGLCVLHRCDNRSCVNPEHLFLGTRTDNTADMDQKGRRAVGERLRITKLSPSTVREIRRAPASVSSAELARRFGVDDKTVWSARNMKTWKHVL